MLSIQSSPLACVSMSQSFINTTEKYQRESHPPISKSGENILLVTSDASVYRNLYMNGTSPLQYLLISVL